MYELFSNLVFFFGNNFVDIRISDITELFRNEVNAEANFIGDTENHSRKGGNMSASQLATNWICIATAGETVDKRAIEEQWLLDAAELYDPSLYTALLWPEHSRNFGNMGEVLELKAERDDEGILRLYARLCPGISLLQANANGQLLFLSPEFTPDGNFRNTGKTYLEGLAVTDSPAGVSTTRLRFSRTNQQSPEGDKWQGRQTRRKGKMLRNMPKLIRIREMPETDSVRLYLAGGHYRNAKGNLPAGVVGYVQQNGMSVTVNRRQVEGREQGDKPASLRQAKRLRKAGYKVRRGKRWRKPGYKEIQEKMTARQAGLLIRILEDKPVKTSWQIDLPARAFLGIGQDDFNRALARQLQAIGFGWDVNAQDIRGRA